MSAALVMAESGRWWRVTRVETDAERDQIVAGYPRATGGRPVTVAVTELRASERRGTR